MKWLKPMAQYTNRTQQKTYFLCGILFGLVSILYACNSPSPVVIDESYKTIHISVFENETMEFALEERLTTSMIHAFNRDGRLKPTLKQNADLEMDVRITDVSMVPLTYTDLDRAVGYTMTVFIAVTVTDLQNEKTLMEDRPFQSTGTFILNYNPATAQSGSVADHLSEQVLSNLIEGW